MGWRRKRIFRNKDEGKERAPKPTHRTREVQADPQRTEAGVPGAGPVLDPRLASTRSVGQHAELLRVGQQTLGNRVMRRLLRRRGQEEAGVDNPRAVLGELGPGRPLDGNLRSRMQSALGEDLSGVRLHTDAAATELASKFDARAFTVGQDVAFAAGEYQPGTLTGDTILAHELAHAVQQGERSASDASREGTAVGYDALERDADSSAVGAAASLWGKATGVFARIAQNAAPSLKSGLRLQRCKKAKQFKIPSYMGRESRKALQRINRIMKNATALQKMIIFGSALTVTTSSPEETLAGGGYDVTPQAQALLAVPVIQRNRVRTVIVGLLLDHENDMNEKEKAFWKRLSKMLDDAERRAEKMSKRRGR